MTGDPAPFRIGAAAWRAALAVSLAGIMAIATTDLPIPLLDGLYDKLKHAAAFFALAMMADYSFPASRFGAAKALAVMGYGVLIEVIQHFLPYREASGLDLVADALGIAAYALSIPLHRHIPILARR